MHDQNQILNFDQAIQACPYGVAYRFLSATIVTVVECPLSDGSLYGLFFWQDGDKQPQLKEVTVGLQSMHTRLLLRDLAPQGQWYSAVREERPLPITIEQARQHIFRQAQDEERQAHKEQRRFFNPRTW